MFDDARRFLALNCALNGHSILDAFDGDLAEAERVLETDKVSEVDTRLQAAKKNALNPDLVVRTLLNFYRTYQYAFITPDGSETMLLSTIADSCRKGELDEELQTLIARQLITDIAYADDLDDISIRDGLLRVPRGMSKEVLASNLEEAFKLFCYGPTMKLNDPVLRYRSSMSVIGFKSMTGAGVMKILNTLVKSGVAPTDYRDTTLLISDLLMLYKEFGLLMCISDVKSKAVDWILPEPEKNRSTAITVDYTVLSSLVYTSAKDLCSIEYGGSKVGLKVKGV